jgi:hypothetical protein
MKSVMGKLCYDCGLRIIDSQDSKIEFVKVDAKQVMAIRICFNFAEAKSDI